MPRPQRAAPMTADDRRAAILRATVPLLRTRGMNVTTRELAEAACVAEGTLFRVFPDKEALVRAAIAQALDPAPLVDELEGLDLGPDLREAVRRAVELVIARSRDVVALLSLSYGASDGDGATVHPRSHPHGHPHGHSPPHHGRDHPVQVIVEAVTDLLTRHGGAERLRREPAVCARMLVGIVLVSALIIVPAAAARNLAPDFRRMMGLSVAFGVIGAVLGLIASFYLDTASGPTMVVVVVLIFVITLLLGRKN